MTVEIDKNLLLPLVSEDPSTIIKVATCRPHGSRGIVELIEVMSGAPIKDTLDKIANHPNTSASNFKIFDESRASGVVVTKYSPFCRTLFSSGGFCKSCILEYASVDKPKVKWRVVLSNNNELNDFLEKLAAKGIPVSPCGIGDLKESALLTLREEQALRLAQELGYFQFPRKTSLRKLSAMLGISASTLDEILRRAEGKIVKEHIRKPNGTDAKKNHDQSV